MQDVNLGRPPSPAPMSEDPTGADWIRWANARSIGHVEFREVTLEIGASIRSRVLRLRTLRLLKDNVSYSVFCVMDPWPLANINYSVVERRGCLEPFDIELYLPYVRGTRHVIPPRRRQETLLGSDFSYEDFRVWLWDEAHDYATVSSDAATVRVRGLCNAQAGLVRHGTAPFDVLLDRISGVVLGVDYWSADAAHIVREYRADDVALIDGVLVPRRMIMRDRERDHVTTVRLHRAWYDRPIVPAVFQSSFRSRTRDYLAQL